MARAAQLTSGAVQGARPKADLARQSSVDSRDGSRGRASVPMEVEDNAMFERKKAVPSLKDSVFQMKRVRLAYLSATLKPCQQTPTPSSVQRRPTGHPLQAHQIKVLSEDVSKKLKSQEGGEGSGSPRGKPSEAAPGKESQGEAAKEEPSKLGRGLTTNLSRAAMPLACRCERWVMCEQGVGRLRRLSPAHLSACRSGRRGSLVWAPASQE